MPGELVHVDVKKLGRIAAAAQATASRAIGARSTRSGRSGSAATGWEFVHVCVDDATRLAYAEVLPDERARPPLGSCARAVAWFAPLGISRRARA